MKKILFYTLLILLLANCTGKKFNEFWFMMGSDLIEWYDLGVFTVDEIKNSLDLLIEKYPDIKMKYHVQDLLQNRMLHCQIIHKIDTTFYCRMFVPLENDKHFKAEIILWRLKKNNENEFIKLYDLTFAEERAIEKEFETEILPKLKECLMEIAINNMLKQRGIEKWEAEH